MSYNELQQRGTVDFPIELYCIDKHHTRYEMASHWHTEPEIIRIISGGLNVKLNDKEYIAREGDVIFVNSETIHGAYPVGECKYECIVFHPGLLSAENDSCRMFMDSILNHRYEVNRFNPYNGSEFHAAANSLFEAMKGDALAGYKFTVLGALYRFFGVIIDSGLCHSADADSVHIDKNVPKLKNALAFIRSNYDKQITLEDMASHAGMSPKYFCRFFREMTRKTPIEYLTAYRIEKASRRLLGSDISVTDTAYSCGFNDLSYFIKTFKALKGTTPGKFRRS